MKFFSDLKQLEPRARRSGLLRLAIVSSGLSKIFGLGLQAISIPLVYHALGQHRYELYLLLSAALASIAIAQLGTGPSLTVGIANAHARGRHDEESSLISATFRLTTVAALIGGGGVLIIIYLISPEALLGPAFSSDRAEIILVANTCVLVLMAQMIFGVVDSALAGYQEQVFTNIGAMFSNILSIGILVAICKGTPSIRGVILTLYGVPTLSRIANLVALYFRRSYLLERLFQSCRGFYGTIFNVGLEFWAFQVGGIIEQNGGTYLLARFSSAEGTNLFAVVYKSLTLAAAVVVVVTQPLWPAFTDAIAHKDIDWIWQSYERIRRILTIYSCAVALVLIVAGRWTFRNILHIPFEDNQMLFGILGVYFIANIWTHLLYVAMMGMTGIWRLAIIILGENLLMVFFGLLLVPRFGAPGMALSYLAASVALPAWILPRLMRIEMRRMRTTLI